MIAGEDRKMKNTITPYVAGCIVLLVTIIMLAVVCAVTFSMIKYSVILQGVTSCIGAHISSIVSSIVLIALQLAVLIGITVFMGACCLGTFVLVMFLWGQVFDAISGEDQDGDLPPTSTEDD